MSEMSSFYGGRQGNSIVIAKRFDGIDIPQVAGSYVYTRGLYAVDENGNFIVTTNSSLSGAVGVGEATTSGGYTRSTTNFLIKKNKDNYLGAEIPNFAYWGGHDNDGSLIAADQTYVFYPELAQGMVQFFKQGARTASEVNYGAYVIIDTILNMNSYNDPDNGKVYRRGMDINSTDGLAGAEYIGQIIGPQGESPEFDIEPYNNVIAMSPHSERSYNYVNDSIVPGSYTIGQTRFYEDEIQYAWATIRDAFGNVTGCKLGFRMPTVIQDYEARSLSPYNQRAVGTDNKYYNYDLIKQDESQYQNITKTFAVNSDNQFILGKATDAGAYEVDSAEGIIYLIEKTDDSEISYPSWQAVNFDGSTVITGSDSKTYTLPEIKKWLHPFYQKWQISVPHGYHGINPQDIEIIHTHTKSPKYNGGSVNIYNTEECSDDDIYKTIIDEDETYQLYGTEYVNVESVDDLDADDEDGRSHIDKIVGRYYIRYGAGYDPDPAVPYARIKLENGTFKYVKKSDCNMDILRYKEVDFDDVEAGIARYFYLGDYDIIDRVTISEDGTLTVFYTCKKQPQDLEQVLRWIDTKDTDGITIDEDGSIHIYYNTLDEEGNHEHQDYPTVLDWITQVSLSSSGKFTVLYNNNTMITGYDDDGKPIRGSRYETTLQWIDYVDFATDGTVTFRWNTDTSRTGTPAYQFSNQIKYLQSVDFQSTKLDPSDTRMDGYEGTGDQKIHIQYNNDGHIDRPLGVPLNYIIETCISTPTSAYPDAPYSHLLVYYSDPDLRLKYKDKWITYPSTKIIDSYIKDEATGTETPVYHVWTEWVDLGNARGDAGGLHIIKNVSKINDLVDSTTGKAIPPEKLTENAGTTEGTIINPNGAGWGCTCDSEEGSSTKLILFYDYSAKEWYSIGSVDASSVDPTYIITKSTPVEGQLPAAADVGTLKTNGFWLAAETAIFAV